jgi:CheY-like chemotaxis protein
MVDRFGETALRLVLIAAREAESLPYATWFKECGFPCTVTWFPRAEALAADGPRRLAAAIGERDAVLVDLEGVGSAEAAGLVDNAASLGAPVVGLLPGAVCDLVYSYLETGLDGYVIKGADTDCVRIVPAVVMWAIDRKRDQRVRANVVDALRHKGRQWSAMLNACLALATYHDAEGRIVWSNASEVDADNRRIDPLFGAPYDEIWRAEEGAQGECPVPHALRTGEPREAVVVGADGSRMLQRAFPVVGDDGGPIGAVASTLNTSALAPAGEAIKFAVRTQGAVTIAGAIAHGPDDLTAGVAARRSGDEEPGRGEVILVVDDEDILRHAVAQYLARSGYLVLKAADGEEALRACARFEDRIHLALLDMIMPGQSGAEVFGALKAARPEMAIVVMSGYDRQMYARQMLEAGALAFLQKPVSMDALAAAVRDALDRAAESAGAAGAAGGKANE